MDDRAPRTAATGLGRFLAPRTADGVVPGGSGEVPTPLAPVLQRYLKPRPRPVPGERCEFCTEPLADRHSHVVDLEQHALKCACRPCFMVFEPEGAGRGRYRAVPDDVTLDPGFQLSEGQWEQLQIPVGIVFVFHQTDQGRPVAFYPGPAGATESLLPLDTWAELQAANPVLAAMLPDVQALLVYRAKRGGQRCFIVPIDACYELVGVIRRTWKGFDGGQEAWAAIDAFFADLTERSRPPRVGSLA